MMTIQGVSAAKGLAPSTRTTLTAVRFERGNEAFALEALKAWKEELRRHKKWAETGRRVNEVDVLRTIRQMERKQRFLNICIPLSIVGLLFAPLTGYPARIATESELIRRLDLPKEARDGLKRKLKLLKSFGLITIRSVDSDKGVAVNVLSLTSRGKRYLEISLADAEKKKTAQPRLFVSKKPLEKPLEKPPEKSLKKSEEKPPGGAAPQA